MDWQFIGRKIELEAIHLRVSEGRSSLLTGAAGVGKSRLAEEARAALESTHIVERLIGSPSVRQLPFGAVAHLGGDAPLPEAAALISFVARAIRKRAAGKPALVVIDDLDQLDDGSIAFVQHLLAHESIPVLATARTDGAADPRIVSLWKDDLIERIDLNAMSRAETDALAATILDGPTTGELRHEIWRLTEGHPLFIRELLLEGLASRAIVDDDGAWSLKSSLGRSQRVADIVQVRTAGLNEAELDGLRAVALCEPVPLQLAKRLAPDNVLESLEARRMVRLETTPEGPVLRSSHPLIAEATTARMPALRMAAMTARLARVLLDSPSVSSTDAMRAGLWLLESGETPPREIALSGARAALRSFDPALARRLAESALSHGSSQEGLVLLGRAYAAAGEAPKAMSVLQDAQERAAGDSELAAAAVALAEVLMFNIGDAQRAVRELEKAAEALLDPGARAEVNSHLMLAVGIIGDFDLGLRIGPQVADQLDLPEPAQLTSVMAMTLTQTMTGQLDLVMERLDRGEALAGRLSDVQPLAADQIGMNRLLAHHARGEFVMAEARARKSLQSGVGLPGPWLFVQAMGRLFTGDVVGGRQLCAEAGAQLADIDPLGVEPQAHGIRALFESMAGNRETAESLADLVRKDPRGAPTRSAVWVDRADAWNLAAGGEPERAADLAVNAGEAAVAGTHYVWGAFAHHDAVRFGHPAKAVEPLRALAEEGRGPLVRLLADHAIAASAGDREALLGVAQRCLQSGALALVSECHAAAAMLTTGVEQRRHAHLAWLYHDRCIGFRSPLVQLVDPTLSRRQLEIASLAAAGHSSKDIARQLHISARTVDNHLRTVFRLFGIDSRTALAELFPS